MIFVTFFGSHPQNLCVDNPVTGMKVYMFFHTSSIF
jgi:hypothetical protein